VCLREIRANDEANLAAVFLLIWTGLKLCQWDGLTEELALLQDRSVISWAAYSPFRSLAFPGLTGEQHRRIAEVIVKRYCRGMSCSEQWTPDVCQNAKQRLRIAYISAIFAFTQWG